MDILIKNMEMPKCCYETDGQVVKPCDFLEVCRRKWGVNINALDIHSEACPLVALPEHHGRLIDADALIEKTRMWSLVRGDEYFELRVNNAIVKELLDAVPTIVEANNGSDN